MPASIATGVGLGITFGEAGVEFDTADLDDRLWHYRASDVVVVGGTTTAADLSPGGKVLSNGGAGSTQPALTTWPGKPATASLYFNGDDFLDGEGTLFPADVGAVYTLILVTTYDDLEWRYVLDSNADAGASGIAVGQSVGDAGKSQVWKKGTDRFAYADAAVDTPQWTMVVFMIAGVHATKVYVNGVLQSLASPTALVTAPIGATWGVGRYKSGDIAYHSGHFAEGLLLAGDKSGLIADINPYMSGRYGTS